MAINKAIEMSDKMDNTFDILDKYVDEHMGEILDIIKKEYLSKLAKAEYVLVGKAVDYEFPNPVIIDKDEHMWYNTFNKWNWTKFENGVVIINERLDNAEVEINEVEE